jgi:hypothetical protein
MPLFVLKLEEHMPISAIGARAHLLDLVIFLYFGEYKLDLT